MPVPSPEEQERLRRVHEIRMRAHWGKSYDVTRNWPQSREDWVAAEHGSPCDANVHMARWHLRVARQMLEEGLLT